MDQEQLQKAVADVIAAVRERGDAALLEFTKRWDGVALDALRTPAAAIDVADVDTEFARAFERATERIRRFHAAVKPHSIAVEDPEGARLGLRWTAIESVGLYIPGGKASYPSTLAMTAVPARIAGVDRIVVVSPPGPDGEVSPQVLLAAKALGIDEIYRVGGAQAVAALAIGTETIPRVDKIFGPGNAFVAEAKKQLYGEVGIDLLAGPSEVVVYADHTADPRCVAADLMAQAEHDEDTRATFLASDDGVLEAVRRAIARDLDAQPRRDVIAASFERNGNFVVVSSHAEAASRINEIAPEHLSIQVEDTNAVLPLVRNAGAIFLGRHSPVAMGDYYAGPNHVLPTGRTARFASCLSVEDFMKRSNLCELTERFVREHGENVEVLAAGERLPAHESSIALRRASGPIGARSGFEAVDAYQLVEEEGEVKLNQNESPWDVPDEIKAEILEAMRNEDWNRYHQRVPEELRGEIARDSGVDAGQVFVGNGSNLILQWIYEAFVGAGRGVLIPSPSFSLYRMWGQLTESRVTTYRLTEDSERPASGFEYPVDEICRRIGEIRPALTVLCLPNNPTGTELELDGLRAVVDAAEAAGGWVLVDEAYREFSIGKGSAFDRTGLARDGRRVFLLRTFSKALAAAGLRIGYVMTNSEAAAAMSKVVPPFHVSLFNAVAGLALWRKRDIFETRIQDLVAERERVASALSALPGLRVLPSAANFFMIRVPDADALHDALRREGVLVRKLWNDPLLSGCLRINVGTPEENDRLIETMRRSP